MSSTPGASIGTIQDSDDTCNHTPSENEQWEISETGLLQRNGNVDALTETQNGMVVEGPVGYSGTITARSREVPPSLPLTSTVIPGIVAVAGTNENVELRGDPKPAVVASTPAEVRQGALDVGGNGEREHEIAASDTVGDEGRQEKRDSRSRKWLQARNDNPNSGEAESATTKMSLADEGDTISTSNGRTENLESEDSSDYVRKMNGATEGRPRNNVSAADVAFSKPATFADIPPIGEKSIDASSSGSSISSVIPMVQAELITPPIEAYDVSIDDDHEAHTIIFGAVSPFELEQVEREGKNRCSCHNFRTRRFSVGCSILVALAIAAAMCVSISLTLLTKKRSQIENSKIPSDTLPTLAPTFPYPCYTSTWDILQDQLVLERMPDAFCICPNTVIQIGTFQDPTANDFTIVDGDYPIMAAQKNVVVQCGLDGKRENNCTLDGGFMQVLTLQEIPYPDGMGFFLATSIDNFTIRGITFTGQLINSGPFQGISVTLSQPGENIRFEDCLWKDFSAQHGLIGIYRNFFQVLVDLPLADNSIDVTFTDCGFENIIYDSPLIMAVKQSIVIERTVFSDISLSAVVAGQCKFESIDFLLEYEDGCAGLLYCGPGSTCFMDDICSSNLDYSGPSIVNVAESAIFEFNNLFLKTTQDSISNNVTVDDENKYNPGGLLSRTPSSEVCELTYIALDNSSISNCTDIFNVSACPIDGR